MEVADFLKDGVFFCVFAENPRLGSLGLGIEGLVAAFASDCCIDRQT